MADAKHPAPKFEDVDAWLPKHLHQRETFLRLLEHLVADDAALAALKGHLVLEEKVTAIIEKFVFHPEQLQGARLTFAQKVAVARSMSLDENMNRVWDVISRLNTLRNALAHSLEGAHRQDAIAKLRDAFLREVPNATEEERNVESALVLNAVALSLGFLDSFEQEVERFRKHVDLLDKVANPHRHNT